MTTSDTSPPLVVFLGVDGQATTLHFGDSSGGIASSGPGIAGSIGHRPTDRNPGATPRASRRCAKGTVAHLRCGGDVWHPGRRWNRAEAKGKILIDTARLCGSLGVGEA